MSVVERYVFESHEVRVVLRDGDPWFVAADVARVLGYEVASKLTRRLDEADKGIHLVDTLGGVQQMSIVSESGLYEAVVRSDVSRARPFRRWVTHEVLPAIRKTGSYSTAPSLEGPALMAAALIEAEKTLKALTAQVVSLVPRAEVADAFLTARGDFSVADAAKALCRSGITVGRDRLFDYLHSIGWVFRGRGDGRWHAAQSAVNASWVCVLAQSHRHPVTGVTVVDVPQVRVTPKGLDRLRVVLEPAG